MYLIDTNVISELMRPRPVPRVVAWLDRHAGDCSLPTIAIFELRAGLCCLPMGSRRDDLMGSLERIVARFGPRVVSFDRASAEMAAEFVGTSRAAGRAISNGDVQMAGIAAVYGLTLVTRNTRDFEVLGIDLVDPWQG